MKYRKRSFAVVSVLFALLMSSSTETLNARDSDLDLLIFAAAQTANRQCMNTCRTRYRDCRSFKQIPLSECRGIYQDCARYTCSAGATDRPSWSGFPRLFDSDGGRSDQRCNCAILLCWRVQYRETGRLRMPNT